MSLLTQFEETLAARERRCRPQCNPADWRDEPTPVVRNRQAWVRTVCGTCGQWIGDRPLAKVDRPLAKVERRGASSES